MEQTLEASRRLLETSALLDELMAEVRGLRDAVRFVEMMQLEGGLAFGAAAATLAPREMST